MLLIRNQGIRKYLNIIKAGVFVLAMGFQANAMSEQANPSSDSVIPPGPSNGELIRNATADVKKNNHLAGIHNKQFETSCADCHGKTMIPKDNAVEINQNCVACHGDYPELAEITAKKAKNPDINVHNSHLGPEISCTTCHQGHKESVTYCVNCHTNFDLPIPGGSK